MISSMMDSCYIKIGGLDLLLNNVMNVSRFALA